MTTLKSIILLFHQYPGVKQADDEDDDPEATQGDEHQGPCPGG